MQDVVKKKTKAVENYRPSRHCRIGFKSKVSDVMFSVLTCYVFFLIGIQYGVSISCFACIFCEDER